jgi:hypothetical protein
MFGIWKLISLVLTFYYGLCAVSSSSSQKNNSMEPPKPGPSSATVANASKHIGHRSHKAIGILRFHTMLAAST